MIRLDTSSFFTDNNYNKNAEKVYFAELTGTRHLTCHKPLQKRYLLPSLTSGVMAKTPAKILREATSILQSLLLHKNKRLINGTANFFASYKHKCWKERDIKVGGGGGRNTAIL